jgi:HAD superfamily hydrolase (TIGR01548 family)
VSRSYRAAIRGTAASYGIELSDGEIAAAKAAGDANDDWSLTQRLLAARGVEAPLSEVTERFEALYQGGLWREETALVDLDWLARLAARLPVAIVTGRPRADAERFLSERGLASAVRVLVAREDAPRLKPDPAPVELALRRLDVRRAWLLGDTPDDVRAARAAGVVPLGVEAPGEVSAEALLRAGAARVLSATTDLEALL